MRHRILILMIFSFLVYSKSSCQDSTKHPKNAFYFGLGKTGLILNSTYDHIFPSKKIGFRIGAGAGLSGKDIEYRTAGAGVYKLLGGPSRYFELGFDFYYLYVYDVTDDVVSARLFYPNYTIETIHPGLNVGYRNYWKRNIFRAGLAPSLIDKKFVPGAYIDFGFTF